MCDITNEYTPEEVINHPKLSDNYKFEYFEKLAKEEDFYEVLNNLGVSIDDLGIGLGDIDSLDYIWEVNEDDTKGIPSHTIEFGKQENFKVMNLYRYISTEYGPSFIGPNTRRFCMELVRRTNASLMRYEDIVRLNSSNPGLGKGGSDSYSVFEWRGGANCKHIWVKYKYDTDTKALVKSPALEQPKNVQVNGKVPFANGTNNPPSRK